MTRKIQGWHCPTDCTCFRCLSKMADPNCLLCEGDGYVVESPGFLDSEVPCKCTEEKRIRRDEKAERESKAGKV